MAKDQTTSPDWEFPKVPDFAKGFADFNRMFADYGKMFTNGKSPLFDVAQVLAAQRKNVEAFTTANQVVFEGVQAVARRQAEIVRRAMEDFSQVSKEFAQAGRPEDKLAKQAALTKEAFETAKANFRELADMLQKSGNEAIEVITNRISDNLEEVKTALKQKATTKH